MQPKASGEHLAADAIDVLMKKIGLSEPHWLETLSNDWVQIVGEGVGRHARPGRVDGTILYVFVDSSVWLNELKRYGHKEMLAAIQKRFGHSRINSIRLQLDPDGH
jgi:predicted nucleic acid-binding Zn ribbon protein